MGRIQGNSQPVHITADIDGNTDIGNVDVTSSVLPDGASTSANQETGITALQLIDNLANALQSIATDELRVDLATMAGADLDADYMTTIDWAHRRIHQKKSFTTHFENTVTNIGEKTVIAFNAPATTQVHMVFEVEADYAANAFLYRDTSIDVDEGTQLVIRCRNQVAPLGTSEVTSIEGTPVVNKMTSFNETQAAGANITTTTELEHLDLVGGDGPHAVGGAAIVRDEWIFSGGTQVAIVISALTADDSVHLIRIDWYEE